MRREKKKKKQKRNSGVGDTAGCQVGVKTGHGLIVFIINTGSNLEYWEEYLISGLEGTKYGTFQSIS